MTSRFDTTRKMVRLVQVAKFYYEDNLSQSEIAKRLSISRPYVSKLLNEVREQGIVKITISSSFKLLSSVESKLKDYYGLKHVAVVPKSENIKPLKLVGEAVAQYINSIIEDGDVVGYTWGETVHSCVNELPVRDDLKNVVTVQLCGGISNNKRNVYVSEVSMAFSSKWGSSGYMLPFPAILDNKKTVEILEKEHTFKEAMGYASKAKIVLITAGGFTSNSALVRAGYLREAEVEKLEKLGAVGDVCTHIINEKGNICDKGIDGRTIAYPFENIKKIDTRIGIGVGGDKAKNIIAALESGVINVLIADEQAIDAVRDIKPEIFT